MRNVKRATAVGELLLITPAALFLIAVLVTGLQPQQYEPAHTAHQIVMWYAVRGWTLWVLLIALPAGALILGCAALLRSWKNTAGQPRAPRQVVAALSTDPSTLLAAGATSTAGGILLIVMLHMLAN